MVFWLKPTRLPNLVVVVVGVVVVGVVVVGGVVVGVVGVVVVVVVEAYKPDSSHRACIKSAICV